MNVCKERCVECDCATELGFCSVTGCIKQNRVSNVAIIPTVTVTDSPMVEYAPIVRCKECKYADVLITGNIYCKHFNEWHLHGTDWFCADGKRKEQNDE